jgi:hypothetical protein
LKLCWEAFRYLFKFLDGPATPKEKNRDKKINFVENYKMEKGRLKVCFFGIMAKHFSIEILGRFIVLSFDFPIFFLLSFNLEIIVFNIFKFRGKSRAF